MANKLVFNAGYATLKEFVALLDGDGEWVGLTNGKQYRTAAGAILNYFPSTGAILFQGPEPARRDFEINLLALINGSTEVSASKVISQVWRNIDFGKYRKSSMSLPQIVLHDPGWFFYVYCDGNHAGPWREQFLYVAERARAIALPPAHRGGCVEHLGFSDGRYGGFRLSEDSIPLASSKRVIRREPSLDLSYVSRKFGNDAIAEQKLLRSFHRYYIKDGCVRLTRRGVEKFFEDDTNFEL